MDIESKPQSGLTKRSALAILYATLVFQPAMVWLYLTTGSAGIPVGFASVLIFSQIARLAGRGLTRQEGTIIGMISGQVAGAYGTAIMLIYRGWLRYSPAAYTFGLSEKLPNFYTPPTGSLGWLGRSLFQSDWILPLGVSMISSLSGYLASLSIAYICKYLFIERENLPFPIEAASAITTITLTEERGERLTFLSIFAFFGLIYGAVAFAAPFIGSAMGVPAETVPLPWIDMNKFIDSIMPGASLGFATSSFEFMTGFLLPFEITVSMLIGSLAISFFGNYLIVKMGVTEFAKMWYSGMPLTQVWYFSVLYAWISPLIGLGLGVGLLPIWRALNVLRKTGRSPCLSSTKPQKISPYLLGGIGFGIGTLVPGLMAYILVPNYPLWLVFSLPAFSAILTIVGARTLGATGTTAFLTPFEEYLTPSLIIISGYQKPDIWFAPSGLNVGGAGVTGTFKYLSVTNTSILSMVKSYLMFLPIGLILGFVFVQAFWWMAPIPSSLFPATQIFWPQSSVRQLLWVTRPIGLFKLDWLLISFIISLGCDVGFTLTHVPISMIGILAGASSAIPSVISIFTGSIVGRFIFQRFYKAEWERRRPILVGGVMVGVGTAITVGGAIGLIIKSLWTMPY